MAKKPKGHFGGSDLDTLHVCAANQTEGGACLTGHSYRHHSFRNKQSCNYRYQCWQQADQNDEIKSYLHAYDKKISGLSQSYSAGAIPTSWYSSKSGSPTPAYYCANIHYPQPGDWDVGGPKRNIPRTSFAKKKTAIKEGENFTRDTWPYWNNAHHLIPKGTLATVITNEGSEVGNLIQQGLLSAKYNINHKVNMLFLPQDKEVAKILDIPRHIHLKEQDDPNVNQECTNHPVYNQMVRIREKGLNAIVNEYRDIVKQALGQNGCNTPSFSLDKQKLEKLSAKLLDLILNWQGGRSLDSLSRQLMEDEKS